jgi:hypothetical protein
MRSAPPQARPPVAASRSRGRRGGAVAVLLLAVLPASASGQDPLGVLLAVRLHEPHTLEAVERIRDTPEAIAAAGELLSAGTTPDIRWAAAYVYAIGGNDPGPLRPLLGDADVTVRVLAGAGLVARGEVDGFVALVDAMGHFEPMPGPGARSPVWAVAASVLVRMTGIARFGPNWDADERRVRLAQARWRAWLEEHRSRLRFDPATGEWQVP